MHITHRLRRCLRGHWQEATATVVGLGLCLSIVIVGPRILATIWPLQANVTMPSTTLTREDVERIVAERRRHTAPITHRSHSDDLRASLRSLPQGTSATVLPSGPELVDTNAARPPTTEVARPLDVATPPVTNPAAPLENPGTETTDAFPAFGTAVFPVQTVPRWGEMTSPQQWNATYAEMMERTDIRFGPVPRYDRTVLTTPMPALLQPRDADGITAKLFYSTRFMGQYDLDSDEHSGTHVGIDLKLALGQPFGTVAGGKVHDVRRNPRLGLHIIVEHRLAGDTYYSTYGHCQSVAVRPGDTVTPGQILGTIGMTGQTTAPHLHLQIDSGTPDAERHEPLTTERASDGRQSLDPITFINRY